LNWKALRESLIPYKGKLKYLMIKEKNVGYNDSLVYDMEGLLGLRAPLKNTAILPEFLAKNPDLRFLRLSFGEIPTIIDHSNLKSLDLFIPNLYGQLSIKCSNLQMLSIKGKKYNDAAISLVLDCPKLAFFRSRNVSFVSISGIWGFLTKLEIIHSKNAEKFLERSFQLEELYWNISESSVTLFGDAEGVNASMVNSILSTCSKLRILMVGRLNVPKFEIKSDSLKQIHLESAGEVKLNCKSLISASLIKSKIILHNCFFPSLESLKVDDRVDICKLNEVAPNLKSFLGGKLYSSGTKN